MIISNTQIDNVLGARFVSRFVTDISDACGDRLCILGVRFGHDCIVVADNARLDVAADIADVLARQQLDIGRRYVALVAELRRITG